MTHSTRRQALPLSGSWHSGTFSKCTSKCNDECHTAPSNPRAATVDDFGAVAARMISRRNILKGGALAGMVLATASLDGLATERVAMAQDGMQIGFTPISASSADSVVVPEGYSWNTFLRWGDPIIKGTPGLTTDYSNLTVEQQEGAFGYNNDFVAFVPATRGGTESDEGLLVVNHEYTQGELMFASYDPDNPTEVQVNIEIAAHGASVVEVYREGGAMYYRRGGALNRRITGTTPMTMTGPAAGHAKLRTSTDPSGTEVMGTFNNCAGGKTPWGTILTAEENFNQYFGLPDGAAAPAEDDPVRVDHDRYGVAYEASGRKWERFVDRFDLSKEPNEPYRHGWIVEIDPYDPDFVPRKHTALGRFKHEGAETTVAPDGRLVAYLGDDERFDYLYKYVSNGTYSPDNTLEENMALLDDGTLYVATFSDDQTGQWIPLVHGQNGLTAENGFADQGDVLIRARAAGDTVGATPMDRPEDVQPDPNRPGYVYVACTNNTRRTEEVGVNAANPRLDNQWGHVIELVEAGNDVGATTFSWDFLLLCGDPEDDSTFFGGYDKSQVSPISAPDNLAFTPSGDLLVATDGQPGGLELNDAFHWVPLTGSERGHVQQFLSVPVGAEACGPEFTPDGQTLFCAVQHPGDGGTLAAPISQFPDPGRGARPAMISIWKTGGGVVGS